MGRAGLGRAAETSWAVFVLVVFLFSWFSRQTTWEIVGPEPDPPPYETGGVTVEAGVPEPGCLKESCSSVMQKLLPHFTEEETEAQRGRRTCPRAHSWSGNVYIHPLKHKLLKLLYIKIPILFLFNASWQMLNSSTQIYIILFNSLRFFLLPV